MAYGKANQNSWTVPPGASSLNIIGKSFPKRGFALANLMAPAPVGFYVSGDVTLAEGRLKGTASGRITKTQPAFPALQGFIASQLAIHLCYYEKQIGSPLVSIMLTPRFPQSSNTGTVAVPIPMTTDAVDVAAFEFSIETPDIAHPEAVWLCAYLSDRNNYRIAGVQ